MSYNRTVDRNEAVASIIEGHQKIKTNPTLTVKTINQFDDIYRNKIYSDGFVSHSVGMMAKGLMLDRTAALSWMNSDKSGFEENVYIRHELGQSDKEISWVYGVDVDSINYILSQRLDK